MTAHLERQFDNVKKMILTLCGHVEDAVERAIRAVDERDSELARSVIANDEQIDAMEIDVEEECLHTLACYQPVAHDLRFIIAVLKINGDLERIADLAANIAEQAQFLAGEPIVDLTVYHLPDMALKVRAMLKQSLDALVNQDVHLAQAVCDTDDEVDTIHREMYDRVARAIRNEPNRAEQIIHFLNISKHLERIADHTTNIAEDVVYMAGGQIIRHDHASSPAAE